MDIDITILLPVIGALTVLVNIITEVAKKAVRECIPTNIFVVLVSELLTLLTLYTYAAIKSIDLPWYAVAAAVVVGLLVAYAAMFGFDKLKETLARLRQ